MRAIDTFFSTEPPGSLFHYTDISALLGIVKSSTLWASHIYYLNDSEEIGEAVGTLSRLVKSRAKGSTGDDAEFHSQFIEWLKTFREPYHLFVFSLSENGNQLSQWRSYCSHGKGVSLGFGPELVHKLLAENPQVRLARCLYRRKEHEEVLSTLLELLTTTVTQRRSEFELTSRAAPSRRLFPLFEEFRGDMLQVLSIVKHEKFNEENEWRLVSPYYRRYTVPDIKFREGASMLMPYVEFKIDRVQGHFSVPGTDQTVRRPPSFFEMVYLGPSPERDLSFSALTTFLSNAGHSALVVDSGIPYRKWQSR